MSHEIPKELKYTEDHEWAKVEGDIVTIGITDFAQSSLGDIVFVELPEVDQEVEKESAFGVVESIKSVSDLNSPVTGVITEVNEDLSDEPEKCNSHPYEAWIIKVKMSDSSEVEGLMDAQKYEQHCQEQE